MELNHFLRRSSSRRPLTGLLVLATAMAVQGTPTPPAWWSSGSAPVIGPAAANNGGPANVGQAKWMASKALNALKLAQPVVGDHVEESLVGPGMPIDTFAAPSPGSDAAKAQFRILTVGQLKAIATPFYQGLSESAPKWLEAERVYFQMPETGSVYPWTEDYQDDSDDSPATIGQLKAVFSLRFDRDLDADGLKDLWEEDYANQLLSLGYPDSYWGVDPTTGIAYSVSLAAGDIVPGHAYLPGGDTAGTEQQNGADVVDIQPKQQLQYRTGIFHINPPGGTTNISELSGHPGGLPLEHKVYTTADIKQKVDAQDWVDFGVGGVMPLVGENSPNSPAGDESWYTAAPGSSGGINCIYRQEKFRYWLPTLSRHSRQVSLIRFTGQGTDYEPQVAQAFDIVEMIVPAGERFSNWREKVLPVVADNFCHRTHYYSVLTDVARRDVAAVDWDGSRNDNFPDTLYSGVTNGDMVSWRMPPMLVDGIHFSQDLTYTWRAVKDSDPSVVITGPSGTGVDHWQIAGLKNTNPELPMNLEGNDPSGKKWLTWDPGDYTIKCDITGFGIVAPDLTMAKVHIGYRSPRVLVIGQIVPTDNFGSFQPDGDLAWGAAVASDILGNLNLFKGTGLGDIAAFVALENAAAANPKKATELWSGSWAGVWAPYITGSSPLAKAPTVSGPFRSSFPWGPWAARGAVSENQNFWMVEHMLTANDDSPKAPDTIKMVSSGPEDPVSYAKVKRDGAYRIFQDFSVKFEVNASGDIVYPEYDKRNCAINGDTKVKLTFTNGEMGIPFDFSTPITGEPSEASPSYNGKPTLATDKKSVSYYASARIGEYGRRVSFRQLNKDAPWIFSEIIFQVGSSGKVTTKVRTSLTAEWSQVETYPAGVQSAPPGQQFAPFNNLNIYMLDQPSKFTLKTTMLMSTHLSEFITSTPLGVWPSPEIPPATH